MFVHLFDMLKGRKVQSSMVIGTVTKEEDFSFSKLAIFIVKCPQTCMVKCPLILLVLKCCN